MSDPVTSAASTACATPSGRASLVARIKYPLAALALGAGWWFVYGRLASGAHWLTCDVLRLPEGAPLAGAVEFFAFEVPKVLLLLVLVVFGVGVVRTYFTPERTRAILAGQRESVGNLLAALLGVVTPFCSCSAVPLFIGFVTAGVPLGVTFSFLIAAPMVNEIALVLLFGLFGWKVAALYLGTGLALAMVAGWIIGRLKLERWVEDWVRAVPQGASAGGGEAVGFAERVAAGREAVRDIVGRVWGYVVLGIAVGAAIHGYVPTNAMAAIMGKGAWWSVPLAVLLGVPMYANAAGIIPVVQALLGKGAALGTVLAFMMAVIGLSFPEAVILRKVLKLPLLVVFFGVVAAGIVLVGFLFNAVL
ncbi:MAG: permease [Candidatus Didemnitutus sp.]|nr:permease [Candidatus Didemnitutus sp.]